MDWSSLEKDKKLFLLIGVPSFAFLILVLCTHYFQFAVFLLIVIGIASLGILRKKDLFKRLTKIGLFGLIIYFIVFSNLLWFPAQMARRMPQGRQSLIEPDHDKVIEFRDDFYEWHLDEYNVSFKKMDEGNKDELELKLDRLDYYVRHIRCEYTNDVEAPYYHYDHVPTIDEIFASDTDDDGKLQDDCDGLSILTCSVLINMGYNAYISECEWHWHTLVFEDDADPSTEKAFKDAIYLYNPMKRPAYYIFNDEELIIPEHRPLTLSFLDVSTGERTYYKYYLRVFTGYYTRLPLWINCILVYSLLLLVCFGISIFIKIGQEGDERDKKFLLKKLLIISLKASIIISFAVFIIYWMTIADLAFLCNLIAAMAFISVLRYTDYKIRLN